VLALFAMMTEIEERMDGAVKIIECPRDAWQGLPEQIEPEMKAAYLHKLIDAGFTHIDAVSFVSPTAVPQMADSKRVLQLLNPPENVEIIGIVVNRKGAERAIATGAVRTLGFPYSISPQFLRRNQNQSQQESIRVLEEISTLAGAAKLGVVAYLSMAFGNPYGDPWSIDEVVTACKLLINSGIKEISLADTVGLATPEQIAETVATVIGTNREVEIGVHLHARPTDAAARIRAAFDAGCRRFDSAIGGLGGCPFAQDELVGNIATENLIAELKKCGATLPSLAPLDELTRANTEIAGRGGAQAQ
jgi:hydroxymethylglutaryl-CoA lyase